MRRLLLVVLLVLASLVAMPTPATACSCSIPPPRAALSTASVVFIGTVVAPATEDIFDSPTVTIDVEQVLKGDIDEGRREFHNLANTSCSFTSRTGIRRGFLLYAWPGEHPMLSTCSATDPDGLVAAARLQPDAIGAVGAAALALMWMFSTRRRSRQRPVA